MNGDHQSVGGALIQRTITMRLKYGLGNQMFQYAHGLALARKTGAELRLEFEDLGRAYGLGVFGIEINKERQVAGDLVEYYDAYNGDPWIVLNGLGQELHHSVSGWFQNEEYFKLVEDELRGIFKVESLDVSVGGKVFPVCVHVRLGDFVGDSCFEVCTPDYYRRGMNWFRENHPNVHFFVVSDDPAKCGHMIEQQVDVEIIPRSSESETFCLMAGCKGFVLSNSSFGWWGAWLAGNPTCIVPDRWLNGKEWPIARQGWIEMSPNREKCLFEMNINNRQKAICDEESFTRAFFCSHRNWTDLLILWKNGTFRRLSRPDEGHWTEGRDSALTLLWQSGQELRLRETPNGFFGDSLIMQEIPRDVLKIPSAEELAKMPVSASVNSTGEWVGAASSSHFFDLSLAVALNEVLGSLGCKTVFDCGCGPGLYVVFLALAGFEVGGVDGNAWTETMTLGLCSIGNLASPIVIPGSDAIICLEVGEHVPAEFEEILVRNITGAADRYLILSWAIPGQVGLGHCNCKSNEDVEALISNQGFKRKVELEGPLRLGAERWWFKDTIMVFERRGYIET